MLLADENGTFSFNGKPQATAFLSQAFIQNAVACGLPLNEPLMTVRGIEQLSHTR